MTRLVHSSTLVSVIIISAIWIAFGVMMRDPWFQSLNGLSVALWTPLIFLGSFIGAVAAWDEAKRLNHNQRAIWLSTPRNWILVRLREIMGKYCSSILLPTITIQLVLLLVGKLLALDGYFDFQYGLYAHAFCLIVYLLGTVVAHIQLGTIRSAILGLFLGLFAGMYIVLTTDSVDTWDIFRPSAWEVIVLCFSILLITVPLLISRKSSSITSASIAGLTSILVAISIFTIGGQQAYGYVRTDTENIDCERNEEGILCLWHEDGYKWEDTRSYRDLTQRIATAADIHINHLVAVEPGTPFNDVLSEEELKQNNYDLVVIANYGGETPSWPAAQSFASLIQKKWNQSCKSQPVEGENLVYDLLSNYIYGDIAYNGFSTSNPAHDAERIDYAQILSRLSKEEQQKRLVAAISSLKTHCSFNPEELISHA